MGGYAVTGAADDVRPAKEAAGHTGRVGLPAPFLHRAVFDGDVRGRSAAVPASVGDRPNLRAGNQSDRGAGKRTVRRKTK